VLISSQICPFLRRLSAKEIAAYLKTLGKKTKSLRIGCHQKTSWQDRRSRRSRLIQKAQQETVTDLARSSKRHALCAMLISDLVK
jgi:hypothetical protein